LLKRFELHGHCQNDWTAVDVVSQNETKYLRITKALHLHPTASAASSETEEIELNEDDDEVAQTLVSPQPVVHYDILLSPTYRVPVLYFIIADIQHRYPPTMETLYSRVIPPYFKAQTDNIGVIGGITVTVGDF
jgi:ubiquitin-like-conjugating enzyme ATG10